MKREVKVRTFPGSRKEKFVKISDGVFEAYVREPTQKNLANMRVRELVAKHFGVSLPHVIIKSGHRSRNKTLTYDTY